MFLHIVGILLSYAINSFATERRNGYEHRKRKNRTWRHRLRITYRRRQNHRRNKIVERCRNRRHHQQSSPTGCPLLRHNQHRHTQPVARMDNAVVDVSRKGQETVAFHPSQKCQIPTACIPVLTTKARRQPENGDYGLYKSLL